MTQEQMYDHITWTTDRNDIMINALGDKNLSWRKQNEDKPLNGK